MWFSILLLAIVVPIRPAVFPAMSTDTQSERPNGHGAISGVVRDRASGVPIAGALVSLISFTKQGRVVPQWTDPKGRFVFVDLPAPQSYHLRVVRFGYLDGAYAHGEPRSALGEQISLKTGEWFPSADVALSRCGSISGKVMDEHGEPVVGAYVRALKSQAIAGAYRFIPGPVEQTDDRGMYRIANLQAGEYVVMVPSVQRTVPGEGSALESGRGDSGPSTSAQSEERDATLILGGYAVPPGARGVYPPLFYPGTPAISNADRITVNAGEEVQGVDTRLQLLAAFNVRGVLQGDASVFGSVILRLVRIGNEELGFAGDAAVTRPNSNGQFCFRSVPAGPYLLEARTTISEYSLKPMAGSSLTASPALPGEGNWRNTFWIEVANTPGVTVTFSTASLGGQDTYWASVPIAIDDHDVSNVSPILTRGAELRGTVSFESTADVARAPSTWRVTLEPYDGSTALGMPSGQAQRDAAAFTVPGVLPGRYLMQFAGLQDFQIKSILWRGKDYTYTPLDIGAEGLADVEITLTRKTAKLSGAAVRKNEASTAPAAVVYFPQNQDEWRQHGLTFRRAGVIPVDNGRYEMSRAPAGEYFVIALPADEVLPLDTPGFLEMLSASATPVSLSWDSSRSADLEIRSRGLR